MDRIRHKLHNLKFELESERWLRVSEKKRQAAKEITSIVTPSLYGIARTLEKEEGEEAK